MYIATTPLCRQYVERPCQRGVAREPTHGLRATSLDSSRRSPDSEVCRPEFGKRRAQSCEGPLRSLSSCSTRSGLLERHGPMATVENVPGRVTAGVLVPLNGGEY